MGFFYGRKILRGEINRKTGKPYTLEDVPKSIRPKVVDFMEHYDAYGNPLPEKKEEQGEEDKKEEPEN